MKMFEKGDKVNFVDSNNRFVGYDMGQCCCESAGWFVSDKIPSKIDDGGGFDFEEFNFDPQFKIGEDKTFMAEEEFDGGGAEIFRLVNGDKELFLVLYNHHNGYYSHGFEFDLGGGKQEGAI